MLTSSVVLLFCKVITFNFGDRTVSFGDGVIDAYRRLLSHVELWMRVNLNANFTSGGH